MGVCKIRVLVIPTIPRQGEEPLHPLEYYGVFLTCHHQPNQCQFKWAGLHTCPSSPLRKFFDLTRGLCFGIVTSTPVPKTFPTQGPSCVILYSCRSPRVNVSLEIQPPGGHLTEGEEASSCVFGHWGHRRYHLLLVQRSSGLSLADPAFTDGNVYGDPAVRESVC